MGSHGHGDATGAVAGAVAGAMAGAIGGGMGGMLSDMTGCILNRDVKKGDKITQEAHYDYDLHPS
jgi:hypothetical protein